MGIHSEAGLNRKYMEMIKLLNLYLNHFPKHEKFALCNVIRSTAYEIYDYITEAQSRYYKKTTLTNLDIAIQKLKMQIYLANELGYFHFKNSKFDDKVNEEHKYLAISRLIGELGKIVGAWINKTKGNVAT